MTSTSEEVRWLVLLASLGLFRTPVMSPDYHSWDYGDQKAAVADLDNDGRKDLLIPSGAAYYGNILYIWRQWRSIGLDGLDQELMNGRTAIRYYEIVRNTDMKGYH